MEVATPEPIYAARHGSRAHGLETKEPHDLVQYEIRKFFRLAADCNPNIIEVFFVYDTGESPLPREADKDLLNALCTEIVQEYLLVDYPHQESRKKFARAKSLGAFPANATIGGEIGIHR